MFFFFDLTSVLLSSDRLLVPDLVNSLYLKGIIEIENSNKA